jgi:multidrug transporter EmrE-like cation transporter
MEEYMNKKNMFLTVVCTISAMQTALPVQPNELQKGWGAVCKAYATSLISGGAIGFITGAFSAYAISKSLASTELSKNYNVNAGTAVFGIIIPAAVLITENQMRSRLVDEVKQTFNENDIHYKRNFISDAAWLASWIIFLNSPDLFKQTLC